MTSSKRTRETDRLLDDIDRLVDDQIDSGTDESGVPLDDYNADRYERCEHCGMDWHGLTSEANGCPGAYADKKEVRRWKRNRKRRKRIHVSDGEPILLGSTLAHVRVFGVVSDPTDPDVITATLEVTPEGFQPVGEISEDVYQQHSHDDLRELPTGTRVFVDPPWIRRHHAQCEPGACHQQCPHLNRSERREIAFSITVGGVEVPISLLPDPDPMRRAQANMRQVCEFAESLMNSDTL